MIISVNGQRIILNHNPFLCYGGAYDGAWQLYGHVYSGPRSKTGKDIPRLSMLFPTQYDVGVDNNGFKPVSFKKEVFKPGQKMSRKAAVQVNLQSALNQRIVFA